MSYLLTASPPRPAPDTSPWPGWRWSYSPYVLPPSHQHISQPHGLAHSPESVPHLVGQLGLGWGSRCIDERAAPGARNIHQGRGKLVEECWVLGPVRAQQLNEFLLPMTPQKMNLHQYALACLKWFLDCIKRFHNCMNFPYSRAHCSTNWEICTTLCSTLLVCSLLLLL